MKNESQKTITRRRMLLGLGNLSLAAAVVSLSRGAWRFLAPPFNQSRAAAVVAGLPESFTAPLTALPDAPVVVGRDPAGLYAVSAVCTHLGCTVAINTDGLVCPCHASRFSGTGQNLAGPAARPLPHLYLWRNAQGQLEIDLSRQVDPQSRLVL
jgi:Rieske Fe-S protein